MVCTHIVTGGSAEADEWRRHCGCLKTSDKLKRILKTFPAPPPPTPTIPIFVTPFDTNCISGLCKHSQCNNPSKNRSQVGLSLPAVQPIKTCEDSCYIENKIDSSCCDNKGGSYRSWKVVSELVQLLQLSVTATALALYYLIYCYMQLVYYTLRSAMYFHNADGPMKITIGVVTVTSLVVAFNMILRLERLVVIF